MSSKTKTKIIDKAQLSSSKKANRAVSKALPKAADSREPRVFRKKFRKGKRIFVEYHDINGNLYNPDGPVREVYRLNGDLVEMAYPVRDRSGIPKSKAEIEANEDSTSPDELLVKSWHKNGLVKSEIYLKKDSIHRSPKEGPAVTRWHENGALKEESYYINGNPTGDESHPTETFWDEAGNIKPKKSRV